MIYSFISLPFCPDPDQDPDPQIYVDPGRAKTCGSVQIRIRIRIRNPVLITHYLFSMPRPSKRQLAGKINCEKKHTHTQTDSTDYYGRLPMEEKKRIISVITLSYNFCPPVCCWLTPSTIIILISYQTIIPKYE